MPSAATRTGSAVDRRKVRHDARRAEIVAQAWELARRDGLAAISLRDLADRVGLRQPSLYAYFDSKLALYDAMFADGNQQLLAAVTAQPFDPDPHEAMVEFLERTVRFAADETVRHQLLFQRTIPGFEPSSESFSFAVEFYAISTRLLTAAGAGNQADVDVFTALAAGLSHQQVANDPGGDRWVRQARRVIEMFLADIHRRALPRKEKP